MNYFHILTLIFVAFKLTNVIQWSWWIVLAPSLVSISVGLLILAGVTALAFYAASKE